MSPGVAASAAGAARAFERVAAALSGERGVTVGGKGFGASGLKVGGKLFAHVRSRERFVVMLPRARVDELVARGRPRRFDPGHGRLMKEWAELEGEEASWLDLAREALRYVGGGAAPRARTPRR